MYEVTFSNYSKVLKKFFPCVEKAIFKSMDDARMRAMALNWTIAEIKEIK
jgi:hypothetical protein